MTDTPDLLAKLDELAAKMLDDAQKEGVSLPNRLDVFKFCSQHYVNTAKVRGKGEPSGGSPTTMGDLRASVAEADQQQGDTDEPSSDSE